MTSDKLLAAGLQIALEIEASAILVYADMDQASKDLWALASASTMPIILAARPGQQLGGLPSNVTVVAVPDFPRTRLGQIKIGLLISVARGLLKKTDRVVVLTGIEHSQQIDTIVVLDLAKESELMAAFDLEISKESIRPEVFERILTLCAQIAQEGREGRQVGTIFVVGDTEAVMKCVKNLVLNPFYGYSAQQRNILDLGLEETIKEFATIDGAFIIGDDGTIESAGARILASATREESHKGLGTRHAAAAAITSITRAISFSISQSTGKISIFKSGALLAEISPSTASQ